jgi:hypothetical protein
MPRSRQTTDETTRAAGRSGGTASAGRIAAMVLPLLGLCLAGPAAAADASFLQSLHHNTFLTTTEPGNGDLNPYALAVSPVSAGTLEKGDVLVGNFNDNKNLQGLGTTIVDYRPSDKKLRLFAAIPRDLAQCPGGVGLTTALAVLKSGWVIVGSLPSKDGTTATKGQGCLIVLNAQGKVAGTFAGPNIDGPWGNMAVIDHGDTATLFVSNTGFGVGAPKGNPPPVVNRATVLRIELSIPAGQPPVVTKETVVAEGFGEQADKGVFIIGPTGLALGKDGVLYVSDALGNRVVAVPDAVTRADSAGTGNEVAKDGLLQRPLALCMTPGGHLLVTNGLNGQVVEIDPKTGKQLGARWVDKDKAQQPPGSGDLFGIAMTPSGDGFYFVADDVNTLNLAH